jgi:hypothetical protein
MLLSCSNAVRALWNWLELGLSMFADSSQQPLVGPGETSRPWNLEDYRQVMASLFGLSQKILRQV